MAKRYYIIKGQKPYGGHWLDVIEEGLGRGVKGTVSIDGKTYGPHWYEYHQLRREDEVDPRYVKPRLGKHKPMQPEPLFADVVRPMFDPNAKPFDQGVKDYGDGLKERDNPYEDIGNRMHWLNGWKHAAAVQAKEEARADEWR